MSVICYKFSQKTVATFITQNIWGNELISPESTGGQLSCCRLIIPPGIAFPLHTHMEAHLLICMEGKGFIDCFESEEPKRFNLVEGDILFLPGGVLHSSGSDEGVKFLVIDVPGVSLEDPNRMQIHGSRQLNANADFP